MARLERSMFSILSLPLEFDGRKEIAIEYSDHIQSDIQNWLSRSSEGRPAAVEFKSEEDNEVLFVTESVDLVTSASQLCTPPPIFGEVPLPVFGNEVPLFIIRLGARVEFGADNA
jgi:hypothetical protein